MNTVWSEYVQGTGTLYESRCLRFHDRLRDQYLSMFALEDGLKILEIGCGPGALAAALHRWYPRAEITGIDRDSAFIRFARRQVSELRFLEAEAGVLPFADGSFDVTISNTVSEHVAPDEFFGEQYRVLKPGGVCIVLSSRRGIRTEAACFAEDDDERAFWRRMYEADDRWERYAVARYPLSEAELPAAMVRYGFREIRTDYAAIHLTPDDPDVPPELARQMLHAQRQNDLDALDALARTLPDRAAEIAAMRQRLDAKHDLRAAQYERGEKQWDTAVSLVMMIRGVK